MRAEKFSEILSRAMSNYLKGLLTNEEVIQELLKIAHEIAHGKESDKALDLNDEELAFYDALTKPEAVRDFYTNEQLVAITRELTDALRCNKTIDWNLKESARAGMRRIVKRLLRKYDYPPEGQEDALSTIMKQCDMWSETADGLAVGKACNSGLPGNRYVLDIPPSALRLRSVNFLLIAVCEPYPVGLGSPCGFVAARHSPLLHGLFERAYDPLLFAAAVRGETQKRQADLDENTVFAPVAGDLHLVEAVVEHAVHLDPQNRRVVHPVVEQKVEMRAAADEEALLVGQLDVPSDQIVQPVVSVDADGGKPILLGENSSDEPFGDPFGRRFAFRIGGEPHGGVLRMLPLDPVAGGVDLALIVDPAVMGVGFSEAVVVRTVKG